MSSERYEYECALSGLVTEGSYHSDSDGLDDLPQGWTEVKFTKRGFNPKWVLIQQVKQAMIEGLVSQLPEEARGPQKIAVRLQVDAQFHTMEKDTPIYATEVETVYLAPSELSAEVSQAYNDARLMLGLDPVEEEEDQEDGEAEEAEAPAVAKTAEQAS